MFVYYFWSIALGLKLLLVGVALIKGLFRRFLFFYFYISLLTVFGMLRMYVHMFDYPQYLAVYWWTQFLIVCAGFWVTWEIFRLTLEGYQGVRKLASLAVIGVFTIVLSQFLLIAIDSNITVGVMGLEKNMRGVEVGLLCSLVALILYYRIPVGLNLLGIFLGYGIFLTSQMAALLLHNALGPSAQYWLNPFRQVIEFLVLFIWLVTLWKFHPKPELCTGELQEDYQILAVRTSKLLANARFYIKRIFIS